MIEFSGKKSDYHMWTAKVLVAGARKGYDKIWDGRVPIPSQQEFTLALAMAKANRAVDEKAAIVSYDLNSMACYFRSAEQHHMVRLRLPK